LLDFSKVNDMRNVMHIKIEGEIKILKLEYGRGIFSFISKYLNSTMEII
jgi:hypothetical protein